MYLICISGGIILIHQYKTRLYKLSYNFIQVCCLYHRVVQVCHSLRQCWNKALDGNPGNKHGLGHTPTAWRQRAGCIKYIIQVVLYYTVVWCSGIICHSIGTLRWIQKMTLEPFRKWASAHQLHDNRVYYGIQRPVAKIGCRQLVSLKIVKEARLPNTS